MMMVLRCLEEEKATVCHAYAAHTMLALGQEQVRDD